MSYTDEQVAFACHEFGRVMQRIHGDPLPSAPWDSESEEVLASTLEGVRRARAGITPRQHFEDWAARKREQGWTWGPEKDPEKRTHPNLVKSYDALPPAERYKDSMFLLIVTGMTVGPLPDVAIRRYQEYGQHAG